MAISRAIAVLFLLAAFGAAAGEDRVVTYVDAREGPAAYRAAGPRLAPGAPVRVIERRGGWAFVEIEPKTKNNGWIPTYTLDSAQSSGAPADVLRRAPKALLRAVTRLVSGGDRPPVITRTVVSVGIRGFSTAYVSQRGLKSGEVDATLWENPPFPPVSYETFVAGRFAGRDWEIFKKRLPLDSPAPLPDEDADRLGAALAAVIAQDGLLRDPQLETYLSLIATLVAESSHAYDLPVRVYVLKSDRPQGYVAPNGIVFVSVGALRQMRSEAEFAFFIGHEIAHIAFQHGMRKMRRDAQRIRESEAFAEMEGKLGWHEREDDKYVRTSRELSELADQVHEYFLREANDADELEADYWGLIYAARAGYLPEAAEPLLLRITEGPAKSGERLLWRGTDRAARIEQCRKAAAQIRLERKQFRTFEDEFRGGTGR